VTLTAKQQAFVEEYLIDLNATQAAIRAGYSERSAAVTASRMLTKANIAEAVVHAKDQRSERTQITQDWVLQTVFDTVEHCKAPGEDFDASAVLKGCDLAGKHLGMFTAKTVLTGPSDGPIRVEDVTPRERGRRIASNARNAMTAKESRVGPLDTTGHIATELHRRRGAPSRHLERAAGRYRDPRK